MCRSAFKLLYTHDLGNFTRREDFNVDHKVSPLEDETIDFNRFLLKWNHQMTLLRNRQRESRLSRWGGGRSGLGGLNMSSTPIPMRIKGRICESVVKGIPAKVSTATW